MNADTFINAVGMIDDRHLEIDTGKKKSGINWKRALVSAAAAAALVLAPLPAMTAFGVERAYNTLYMIAPSVAQTFKPVEKSCEDKGIEMTVISADRSGSEAKVYLAMHDKAGVYPDGEWDLFDSYRINVPRDMSGTCSFAEYDPETDTTYFLVELATMDGSAMPEGKVTFSVYNMLLGKEKTEGAIESIDLNAVPYEPQTCTVDRDRFSSYAPEDEEKLSKMSFLTEPEQPLCTPAHGISIMNAGYFDGELHILMKFDDIGHTDNHGYVYLTDKDGNSIGADEETGRTYQYWDETRTDSYEEQVIKVDHDKLGEYTLCGKFTTCEQYIAGDWQVTFPLE